MNLNQLNLFYHTARCKSPSAAAKALNVSQPAVTTGIRRLEDHYNVMLFQREGKSMELTEAGAALYEMAGKLFEIERLAEDCIRNFQIENEQSIQIHASETFGAYYLPDLINRFKASYPHVNISVNIMLTDQVVANTIDIKNDVGFISYPIENERLSIHEVMEDKLVLITSPDHPLAAKARIEPADLERQVIIMHEKSSAIRKALLAFVEKGNIQIRTSIEYSNNEAIKRAVELKAGVALISQLVADKEINRGEFKAIPLSDYSVGRKFYVIHHKDKFIFKGLENFLDTMKDWKTEYQCDKDPAH
ncbi:MAG: LysR family transcriptional regulator [Thermodesulfobacteriota bacterium]